MTGYPELTTIQIITSALPTTLTLPIGEGLPTIRPERDTFAWTTTLLGLLQRLSTNNLHLSDVIDLQ
jgi:hypothetical protein